MTPTPVIEARGLQLTYDSGPTRVEALRDVSLTLRSGQVGALLGRSGSGKTSLLQVLGLLARPDAGTVLIRGCDTTGWSPRERAEARGADLGFVFQSANLLPQHNALVNVMLAWRGPAAIGRARALSLLDGLGLGDRVGHRPDQLSGGEQQRVAVARALINDPIAVLADEPTGALDVETEQVLLDTLVALAASGTAVLIITHSSVVAARAGVRWALDSGRIAPLDESEVVR